MSMTMTQKILARHAGLNDVKPGQLIEASCDLLLANDITAPIAVNELKKQNVNKVFDADKIALVLDHFAPNKDIAAAEQCACVRAFARSQNISSFFDEGDMGIEHALLPEKGLVVSGDCVIGADSHTCTYGALGAFSTGMGSTDIAFAMATGKTWFKVPSAIKVVLKGSLPPLVCGKDVILNLISKIGVDGASYKSIEFYGEGIKSLSMDDRFTICNMAVEAGAKNGIFPVDEKTLEYISKHSNKKPVIVSADADCDYDFEIEINLSELVPSVAFPSLPSNVYTAIDAEQKNIKIDQVVIGSCTNGRLSDMEAAAKILKNHKKAPNLRLIIIPATKEIYRECIRRGYIDTFIDAGSVVSPPTCGPCLGGYMGVLAKGERCLSTTNRNFVGRMGHTESEVYLSSPYVAAKTAITGKIACPVSEDLQ